jgi:ATP-dependent Clp protease ATP-binding subunit ClpB
MEAVRAHFRPEFLNRLDEILLFTRLSRENLRHIVAIQLKDLSDRLMKEHHVTLIVEESALDYFGDAGFDPLYGARPLKRLIQRTLQDQLATGILSGEIVKGQTVTVTSHDDQIFTKS